LVGLCWIAVNNHRHQIEWWATRERHRSSLVISNLLGEIHVAMEHIDNGSRAGEFERGVGAMASICKCNP
jgi:hypothetical protein